MTDPGIGDNFDGDDLLPVHPLEGRWVDEELRGSSRSTALSQDRQVAPPPVSSTVETGVGWSTAAIWLIGIVGLGLPSLCMRPSFVTVIRFGLFIIAIPAAFMFFGPYWDQVLFAGSDRSSLGLYLFFASCICVPLLSVYFGFRDRWRLHGEADDSSDRQ